MFASVCFLNKSATELLWRNGTILLTGGNHKSSNHEGSNHKRTYYFSKLLNSKSMEVKEAIIKKKLARKKLASKMTVGDTIELLVYISRNTAFLKSFQKKQLKDIMTKANNGEAVTLQDNIKLIEMKGVIRVYLVPNQMNVTSRSNRLERYSLTYDHKNHI